MIYSEQYIDIGTGSKSNILAYTAQHYKKVNTNILDIKKPQKLYTAFNIPSNENIVAYCKDSGISFFGLTISGMVFTDKALYSEFGEKRRILYTDLCKYLIIKDSDEEDGKYEANHSGLIFKTSDADLKIFNGTVISKNTAANELFELLTAIQNELCKKNPTAKTQMDLTIKEILNVYRYKMACGELSNHDRVAIRALQLKANYKKSAILLIAETKYRFFNKVNYYSYIKQLTDIDDEFKKELRLPKKLFYKDFIADLSNVKLNISESYLKTIQNNILDVENYKKTEEMHIVYSFASIRLGDFATAEKIMNLVEKQFGNGCTLLVENFKLIYGNLKMRAVYEALVKSNDIPNELSGFKDGLGLTPLHYAFILNKQNLSDFLDLREWDKEITHLKQKNVYQIYNYLMLALYKDRNNFIELIEEIDSEIKELKFQIETLKAQQREALEMRKDIQQCIRDARKKISELFDSNTGYCEISDLRETINDLENQSSKLLNVYYECEEKIPKYTDELRKKINNRRIQAKVDFKNILSSNSSFFKLLLEIYRNDNRQYLLKNFVYSDNSTVRIYDYNGYRFLTPDSIILDFPYTKVSVNEQGQIICDIQIENRQNAFSKPNKLFGSSWFSPEAHIDLSILTKEYRKLVKLYHPDICKEAYAHDLFVKINEEHEQIASKL